MSGMGVVVGKLVWVVKGCQVWAAAMDGGGLSLESEAGAAVVDGGGWLGGSASMGDRPSISHRRGHVGVHGLDREIEEWVDLATVELTGEGEVLWG